MNNVAELVAPRQPSPLPSNILKIYEEKWRGFQDGSVKPICAEEYWIVHSVLLDHNRAVKELNARYF